MGVDEGAEGFRAGHERERFHEVMDRRAAGGRRHGVYGVAAGDRLGVVQRGKRRLPGGRILLGGDGRLGFAREAASAVGVFIEDRAHLLPREGRVAFLGQSVHLGAGGGRIPLGGDADILADRGDVLGRHAAALQRRDERLLDLQHAFGRELDAVLRRLPDVVVDLDELRGAILAGGEVDLPGVVRAGRDAVEVRETDFSCHGFPP